MGDFAGVGSLHTLELSDVDIFLIHLATLPKAATVAAFPFDFYLETMLTGVGGAL